MSWLFSQALVEAYSEGGSLGGAPWAQLNVMPSPHPFWRNDRTMDASRFSRFGPTCAVLTAEHGAAVLTSYLEDFPARTSALPARAMDSTARAADFGGKCGASLARWDRASSSWKTRQLSLFEEACESLETLPKWGMIVGGELWPLPTPSGLEELRASITSASASGSSESVPTPTAGDARSSGSRNLAGSKAHAGVSLTDFVLTGNSSTPRRMPTPQAYSKGNSSSRPGLTALDIAVRPGMEKHAERAKDRRKGVKRMPTPTVQDSSNNGAPSQMERNTKPLNAEVGGPLNPMWVEWLMGWPIGWTDLNAPATDRFQRWCGSHGMSLEKKAHE